MQQLCSNPKFDYGYDGDAVGRCRPDRDLYGYRQLQQQYYSESDVVSDMDLVEYGGSHDCGRDGHDFDSRIDDDYGVHERRERNGYTDGDSARARFDCGDAGERYGSGWHPYAIYGDGYVQR